MCYEKTFPITLNETVPTEGYKAVYLYKGSYFGLFTYSLFRKVRWNIAKVVDRNAKIPVKVSKAGAGADYLLHKLFPDFKGGYGFFTSIEQARDYLKYEKRLRRISGVIIKIRVDKVFARFDDGYYQGYLCKKAGFLEQMEEIK